MNKENEESNCQSWELEVTCKNKKYLKAVVKAILKRGVIDFEVESTDVIQSYPEWDARYTVFMTCSWFHNLMDIAKDLAKIEKKMNDDRQEI